MNKMDYNYYKQCGAMTALKDDHFITCTYGNKIQEWLTSLSFYTFIQVHQAI